MTTARSSAARQPQHRSRRVPAIVALGLAVALAAPGCAGRSRNGTAVPPASPAATASAQPPVTSANPTTRPQPGTWRLLPAAPVPKGHYVGVWTGTEFIIDGANSSGGVLAAAYNPTSNTWRALPPSDYPVRTVQDGQHVAWDGTEMLTWGQTDAAYNPATNQWRRLPEPPVRGSLITVWTGRQVLTWGGGCCDTAVGGGAAYDPVLDSWQPIPAGPLAARIAPGAWTGTELIVVGGNDFHGLLTDAAAYNPTTRSWRQLPPLPTPQDGAAVVWTGAEVLVVGGLSSTKPGHYADNIAYNPTTNNWRRLPDTGIDRFQPNAVWTGSRLLVWGGATLPANGQGNAGIPPHGVDYDPAGNSWSALPESPLRGRTGAVAVWTGTEMIIWGGLGIPNGVQSTDGAAYLPAAT